MPLFNFSSSGFNCKGRRSLAVLLLVFLSVLLLPINYVAAQSFRLPRVDVRAEVLPDGSMVVEEARTWYFDGSFSWVEQWLNHDQGQGPEIISMGEPDRPYTESTGSAPGTYSVTPRGDHTVLRWNFAARDEERTFVIKYRVPDAVTVYTDTAELYWQFIGDDWEVSTRRANVALSLPAGEDEPRAWGHGPLWGNVILQGTGEVLWEIEDLPAETFLEGRVLFAPERVPAATNVRDEEALLTILKEEQQWADDANRRRERAQWAQKADPFLAGGILLAALAGGFMLYRRHGRNPAPRFKDLYYRELPADYSPAAAGLLWRRGKEIGGPELSATLLDLSRRGLIRLEPDTVRKRGLGGLLGGTMEDVKVTLVNQPAGPTDPSPRPEQDEKALRSHERQLLRFLFNRVAQNQPEFHLSQLPPWFRSNTNATRTFIKSWENSVRQELSSHGVWPDRSGPGYILSFAPGQLLSLGLGAVSFFALFPLFPTIPFTGGALFVTGAVLLLVAFARPTLSQTGVEQWARWGAFRKFLTHFSRLDLAELPAVVLWEHFLVYATVFGVAKEVLKQMRDVMPRLPEEQQAHLRRGMFAGHGLAAQMGTGGGIDVLGRATDSISSALQHTARAARSSSSSGSGRGGGFSGTGAGGGGGGGGGGRAG